MLNCWMLHSYWLYRATKLQKKFVRLAILCATIIKFDNSPFFGCIIYFLTVMKIVLCFHIQWPLAYNDVTEPLCLLHFCLFMPQFCFCYPNLPKFTDVLSTFSGRTPCVAYIFIAGKQIQYIGRIQYVVISLHSFNKTSA